MIDINSESFTQPNFDFKRIKRIVTEYAMTNSNEYFWKQRAKFPVSFQELTSHVIANYTDNWIEVPRTKMKSNDELTVLLDRINTLFPPDQTSQLFNKTYIDISIDYLRFSNDNFSCIAQLVFFLSEIITKSRSPLLLLRRFAQFMTPFSFFDPVSRKSSELLIITSAEYKSSFFSKSENVWVYMTSDKTFYMVSEPTEKVVFSGKIYGFSKKANKASLKVGSDEISFVCISNSAVDLWEEAISRPISLIESIPYMNQGKYPPVFINVFRNALFCDDMLFLESLLTYHYGQLADSIPFVDSLITVAIKQCYIDKLLSFVTFNEISQTPDKNLILRANSVCTRFFRAYYNRYSRQYVYTVIKPLVQLVTELPIEDLCDSSTKPSEIGPTLFRVCNSIISSFSLIPGPLRHLAFHVADAAMCCCDSRDTVFHAITSFFCLRFIVPYFTDPTLIGLENVNPLRIRKVLAPFGQLLHDALTLIGFKGKFQHLDGLTPEFESKKKEFFEFFIKIPLGIGDDPGYPIPTEPICSDAVTLIIDHLLTKKIEIINIYRELIVKVDRVHPYSFRLLKLICSAFQKYGDSN